MHQPIEGSIKIVRMITGEDIIGVVNKITDGIAINQPFRISYVINATGTKMSITLNPWMFQELCIEQKFDIKDRDIILTAMPTNIIIQEYKRIVQKEYSNLDIENVQDLIHEELEDDEFQEMFTSTPTKRTKFH